MLDPGPGLYPPYRGGAADKADPGLEQGGGAGEKLGDGGITFDSRKDGELRI